MERQKGWLTSGAFAALCGTTKETLRHYKDIGLLSPAHQGDNGYFYYDVEQFYNFYAISIFRQTGTPLEEDRKRRGRSRYLLSVMVDVVKEGKIIPAKVVYVRNRNKRNEYLCLISTDVSLSEEEIIRIYGKRWDIEVFFKVCKSYLNLSKIGRAHV